MAFNDTYRESIQTKHMSNVGFTTTAKGVTNESYSTKNPHQVLPTQMAAVDVVGTYGIYTASGVAAGLVEEHTVELTADPTVNNNKAWIATEDNCTTAGHSARGTIRIDQWMRYPETGYKLRLYEDDGGGSINLAAEILPSETQFNWEYDASAGIVYFDEDPSVNGKTIPLWGVFYTYVGEFVSDKFDTTVSGAGGDHNLLTNRNAADQHPASSISTSTGLFDGALSSADDTSQKAFDTLDDAVQTNSDAITALDAELTTASGVLQSQIDTNASDIGDNTSDITNNYNILDSKIDTTSGTLQSDIDTNTTNITNNYNTLDTKIDTTSGTLQTAIDDFGESQNEFIELTDTISSYTEGRLLFESTNAVIDDGNLTYVSGTQTFSSPNVSVGTDLTVGNDVGITGDVSIDGTLGFDSGTTVDEFITTVDFSSTDNQAPTALAVYTHVNSVSGTLQSDIDTNSINITNNYNTLDSKIDTTSGTLQTEITNNYNTLDTKIDTTSGTLQSAIDDLDSSLTEDIIWEVVDTPTIQIRPKVEHQGKALYSYGNMTIGGDLTVSGTMTTIHSEELTVADKVITVNAGEAGAGITGDRYAGIEVDRGSETNYMFVFDEVQDNFRIGISGSLQAVATREDTPTDTRVPYWNDSAVRFDTSGTTYMTINTSSPRVTSSVNDNEWLDVGTTITDIFAPGNSTQANNSYLRLQGGTASFYAGTGSAASVVEFSADENGISLKTGTSVNDITAIISKPGDDDTLATEKAIIDYVAQEAANYNEFTDLTDTPSSYSTGDYLVSTASGLEWTTTIDHNDDTSGKDGGGGGEFNHLSADEYSQISAADSTHFTFAAGTALSVAGTLVLATGTTVNAVIDSTGNISASSTDDQLATAKLIYDELQDVATSSGTLDHALLSNLDYASSGHTGFSPSGHTHTESDITDLGNYSVVGHGHTEADISDLDKYTQAEVDAMVAAQNEFIELTDTISLYNAGRVLFTTASGVVDDSDFTFDSSTGTISTTAVTLGTGGSVNEVVTTVVSGSTDDQIPTAKAVWDLTEDAASAVHTHYDADAVHVSDTSWTYGSGFSGLPDGLTIFVNGVKQHLGAANDYTVADVGGVITITFNYSVRTADWVSVTYYA